MKNKSEIRKDYFLDRYVIITPSRAKRPFEIREKTVVGQSESCHFCPDHIERSNVLDRLGGAKRWQVLSVKNIFPAVSKNNPGAYGTQEVIVDTPSHTKDFGQFSEREIESVLRMYALRTKKISRDKKINYILCFKNSGAKAGASKVHAHSQIFATNLLPPEIQEELICASAYESSSGHCPYCDIIKQEGRSVRKIFADKYVVAFAPHASQYHYEAWIFTRRHIDNITEMKSAEFKSFAKALKKIVSKLYGLNLSYNFFLHQVITNKNQHFCLKVQPRDSIWGGVELGTGLVINSIPPESAAKFYRQ